MLKKKQSKFFEEKLTQQQEHIQNLKEQYQSREILNSTNIQYFQDQSFDILLVHFKNLKDQIKQKQSISSFVLIQDGKLSIISERSRVETSENVEDSSIDKKCSDENKEKEIKAVKIKTEKNKEEKKEKSAHIKNQQLTNEDDQENTNVQTEIQNSLEKSTEKKNGKKFSNMKNSSELLQKSVQISPILRNTLTQINSHQLTNYSETEELGQRQSRMDIFGKEINRQKMHQISFHKEVKVKLIPKDQKEQCNLDNVSLKKEKEGIFPNLNIAIISGKEIKKQQKIKEYNEIWEINTNYIKTKASMRVAYDQVIWNCCLCSI